MEKPFCTSFNQFNYFILILFCYLWALVFLSFSFDKNSLDFSKDIFSIFKTIQYQHKLLIFYLKADQQI